MLELKIINNPEDYLKQAENFFSVSFCKDLKTLKPWTYLESLVARYFISIFNSPPSPPLEGGIWENFSSISHKKDLVFIWISEKKIWVDIEIIKQRDIGLLEKFKKEEYWILWAQNRKFQRAEALCWQNNKLFNFYILWTAKEAIIKYEDLLLDDMEDILLMKNSLSTEGFSPLNWWIQFQNKLILNYRDKKFTVYCWQEENKVFSVCVSSKFL